MEIKYLSQPILLPELRSRLPSILGCNFIRMKNAEDFDISDESLRIEISEAISEMRLARMSAYGCVSLK